WSARLVCLALGLFWMQACGQHYEEGSHPPPRPPAVTTLPQNHPPTNTQKPAASSEKGTVRGTVTIAPELANRIPSGAYLYIIARERPDGGPPYAFKRIRVPSFPYTYTLTQGDVGQMFGEGIVLTDIPEMYLVAKIDQDGRVGAQPGDMEGACAHNPVAAGEQGGDIVIDRVNE
ncbi:MAG: hypothetical protein O2954_21045, partial [bacterium]|nr:hypothetical protein [bacterium]